MSDSAIVRPHLEDMIYFGLLNYWAAYKSSLENNGLIVDEKDKTLFDLFQQYVRDKHNSRHQGVVNSAVCAVVVYQDMFDKDGAILGSFIGNEKHPYSGPDELLQELIQMNLKDDERGAVIGGSLENEVGFGFPTAFNYIKTRYRLRAVDIFQRFLPCDFADIDCQNPDAMYGTRNEGIIGAALLGPVEGAEYADVLAFKQSMYGRWGKIIEIKATVDEDGYPVSYSLDEILFVSESQVRRLIDIDADKLLDGVRKEDNLRPDLKRPVYMVRRKYQLEIPERNPAEPLGQSVLRCNLKVTDAKIIHPEDIFGYVHDRRSK
jgi:hypothetical protein